MNFVKIKAPIQMISFFLISVDRKQYESEVLPHIYIYGKASSHQHVLPQALSLRRALLQ